MTLALRLNFGSRADKIVLGAVGVDLRSYGSLAPVCDIRFSLQSRYATVTDLSAFGVTNNAVTLHAQALLGEDQPVENFICTPEDEIYRALESFSASNGIDANTNDLVVIDIEPQDTTDPAHPRSFSPASLGSTAWDGDLRDRIIEGYKRRIAVAREVFPHAKLSLYQVIAPRDKGENDPPFQRSRRMRGYQRASQLGMYDQLDYISPSLYVRYGPGDVDLDAGRTLETIYGWLEARTRQGIESSLTLTRSNGAHIPLAPFLSFWVFNAAPEHPSRDDRKPVSDESMRRQLRMLQEYCGVKIIVLWAGREIGDRISAHNTELVNANDFLTQVGELPPRGCE